MSGEEGLSLDSVTIDYRREAEAQDSQDNAKAKNTKICPGRKVSPWTMLLTIEDAIKPQSDDTAELSMKAPMSVSKPADLG